MKLTVLVDNNTFIDQYFYGEPAVSYYIEIDNLNILFDVGYSDIFIKNATRLGICLKDVDHLVLSHGHNDHTGGLSLFYELFENSRTDKPSLISHPDTILPKYFNDESIGLSERQLELIKKIKCNLTKKTFYLSDNAIFLGEIPRNNDFENKDPIGNYIKDSISRADYLKDDSALVCKTEKGLLIVTGCSHSGICNIIEYAKKVTGDDKIYGVIGGFHLLTPDSNLLKKTLDYFKKTKADILYPCHCVDFQTKFELAKIGNVQEVGVGLEISL